MNDFDPVTNFIASDHIGRLEVFLNGSWGTVCINGFDFFDGEILCRQLGFRHSYRFSDVGSLRYVITNYTYYVQST